MSKKCPICGSDDTEIALINYAGRAALNTLRYSAAVGIAIGAGLIGPFARNVGHAAGHSFLKETDPGELKGYHCRNCGSEFSA